MVSNFIARSKILERPTRITIATGEWVARTFEKWKRNTIYTWNHLMKNLGIKSNHHCHDHHCQHFVISWDHPSEELLWGFYLGTLLVKTKTQNPPASAFIQLEEVPQRWPSLVHEDQVQWSQDDWWRCPRGSWGCRLASSPPVAQQRKKREASVGESGLIQSVIRWFSKKNWFKQHPNWKMRVGFKRNLNWKMVLCGTQH